MIITFFVFNFKYIFILNACIYVVFNAVTGIDACICDIGLDALLRFDRNGGLGAWIAAWQSMTLLSGLVFGLASAGGG